MTSTPSKCSTTIQFLTLAEMLLDMEGVFIYWPIPDRLTEEEVSYLPDSPKIRYLSVPMHKDRLREYNRVSPELEEILAFDGICWDWDVLITVRSTQVPMMCVHSISPRQPYMRASKRVVLIEDMMISSKKHGVSLSVPDVQDRLTIEAYLAADKVLMPAYHQKPWVREMARGSFSPHTVMEASDKVVEVCHLNMGEYEVKDSAYLYDGSRKLQVAFVGRLEKFSNQLRSVNSVMVKQFITNPQVEFFVCTVTDGRKVFTEDVVEVLHPDRNEFWDICRTRMDLGIVLTVDVELYMSMLEPISLGVPFIVLKKDWSVASLGEDYPFFVNSEKEAYAYVGIFTKDYEAQYSLFLKWREEWFIPEYERRVSEDSLYGALVGEVLTERPHLSTLCPSLENNTIVRLLAGLEQEELTVHDGIKRLSESGAINDLGAKLKDGDRDGRGLVWGTPWNDYRMALIDFYGYKDASTVTGHLVKG